MRSALFTLLPALLAGCATASASGEASVSVDRPALPQPVEALAGHAAREFNAEQTLQKGLEACDQAQGNAHLLPSEFLAMEARYTDRVQQAMLADGTLRNSQTQWKSSSGESASYDAWLTRCEGWFKANHEAFAQAAPAEERAKAGKPVASSPQLVRTCKVVGGKPTACESLYTGPAVLESAGLLRSCDVEEGQVTHCGEGHEGQAVAQHNGLLRECDLAAGRVVACSEQGFDGASHLPSP